MYLLRYTYKCSEYQYLLLINYVFLFKKKSRLSFFQFRLISLILTISKLSDRMEKTCWISQTYLTFTSLHQVKLKQMKMIEYERLMSKVLDYFSIDVHVKRVVFTTSTAKSYIVISGQKKMTKSLSSKQLSILIWKIIIISICKDFYIEKKIEKIR